MKIICDECPEAEGTVKTAKEWQLHLAGNLHQMREQIRREVIGSSTNLEEWKEEQDKRTLVVTQLPLIGTVSNCANKLIQHFSVYGFVVNLYVDLRMKYCLIDFDEEVSMLYTMKFTHIIDGKIVHVVPKTSLTKSQWEVLRKLPAGDDQMFQLNHLSLETKLSSVDMPNQLQVFLDSLKSEDGVGKRSNILDELLAILKPRYPFCILYPYGSFKTGLFDMDNAFEIQVDPFGNIGINKNNTNAFYPSVPPESFDCVYGNIMQGLRTYMVGEKPFCLELNRHQVADRDLSIRFIHNETGIECLLHFNDHIQVHLSHLTSFLLQVDSLAYPLLQFVLYWARYNNLHKQMNQSLILLCIAYLNQKEVLPTVAALQSFSMPRSMVQGFNVSYCNNLSYVKQNMKKPVETPMDNQATYKILNYASEFFELCATTDFKKFVVCGNTGALIPRELFVCGQEFKLPVTMNAYKAWRQSMGPSHHLNIDTPLCVQHPFHLGLNESARLSGDVLNKFQKEAFDVMNNLKKILKKEATNLLDAFSKIKMDRTINTQVPFNFSYDQSKSKDSKSNGHPSQPPILNSMENAAYNLRTALSISEENQDKLQNLSASKKIMRIKTSRKFIDTFNQKLELNQPSEVLEFKRKALVNIFLWDFLSIVWGHCFYMTAEQEEILYTDPQFNDVEHLLRGKFLHKYTPRMIYKDGKKCGSSQDTSIVATSDEPMICTIKDCANRINISEAVMKKIENIPTKIRNNFCRVIQCRGLGDVWIGRQVVKAKLKESRASSKDEINNPIIEEEIVTKQILSQIGVQTENVMQFSCTALMDMKYEMPILYIVLKDENPNLSPNFEQAAEYISSSFGKIINNYMTFRLEQWLQCDISQNEFLDPIFTKF